MGRYTDGDKINLRLRGRATTGGASPFGVSSVDDELLERMITQVEDRVDRYLAQLYKLPLVNEHPMLAAIVENGVLCQLFGDSGTHFRGTEVNPADAFGHGCCKAYSAGLQELIDQRVALLNEKSVTGTSVELPQNFIAAATRTGGTTVDFGGRANVWHNH
jgi:hypothetical protein